MGRAEWAAVTSRRPNGDGPMTLGA